MKTLVIRQHKSLFNQRYLENRLVRITKTRAFKIKRKGKRCFSIFFEEPIDKAMAFTLAKSLGLSVNYQSEKRSILTDVF